MGPALAHKRFTALAPCADCVRRFRDRFERRGERRLLSIRIRLCKPLVFNLNRDVRARCDKKCWLTCHARAVTLTGQLSNTCDYQHPHLLVGMVSM